MHKAIVVRNAIVSLLGSLETSGVVKEITKGARLTNDHPSISVLIGSDDVANKNSAFINWELTVYTDITISSTDEDVDALAQNVRKEIHKALMSDYTLGLDFVTEIDPIGQQEPKRSDDSDLYNSVTSVAWLVRYRTSVADPSL